MGCLSSQTPVDFSTDTELPRGWHHRVVGALAHRNFRIVWFAALGSTIGTWMQQYAQSLLIYQLTKSNFYLGIDSFLAQLPILLLMLIGGVIADRHDRRRLLTTSQYIQAAAAFALATLVFTGTVSVWYIFALSFISGCGQAFGGPAYQSLIPSLVPRRDLPSAIGLNSTQFNLSRALGPAAGGAVLATIGMAWCFALNGLSFFIVVIALAWLHLPKHAPSTSRQSIRNDLQTGLRYVRNHRLILTLIILGFVSTFLAMPLITLMPSFATDVLAGFGTPEARLSMLMVFQGFGAITGALIVGSLGQFKRMGAALLAVQFALGLLLAAFALSRTFELSLLVLFVCGMFYMAVFSISFSLVQLTVPDELRGRVISIYMVAIRSGGPIGALVAGALADAFSAPGVMTMNGLALSLVGVMLLTLGKGTSLRQV
jgi:MFS family permease